MKDHFKTLALVVLCIVFSSLFKNASLMWIGAGLCGMISSSTTIAQVAVQRCNGVGFPVRSYLALVVAFGGIVLATLAAPGTVVGYSGIFVLGCIVCFISAFGRALRGFFQQKLLDPCSVSTMSKRSGDAQKVHPLQVTYWMGTGAVGTILPLSFVLEGLAPWQRLNEWAVLAQVAWSCFSATWITVGSLYATQMLGAAGAFNVRQLQPVLVILFSITFDDEKVTVLECCGLVLIIVGTYWFEFTREEITNPSGIATYRSDLTSFDGDEVELAKGVAAI